MKNVIVATQNVKWLPAPPMADNIGLCHAMLSAVLSAISIFVYPVSFSLFACVRRRQVDTTQRETDSFIFQVLTVSYVSFP